MTNLARVDEEWEKRMRDIMKERVNKNLAKLKPGEVSLREATSLMLKAPSWSNVELELRNLPKRRKNG